NARLIEKSNRIVKKLHNWLCMNKLLINVKKCKIIKYNWIKDNSILNAVRLHSNDCSNLNCNVCPPLDYVNNYKYLGIIIDSKLSWTDHVNYIACKLRYCLVMLYKLKPICSEMTLKIVYHALFQSYLQYCLIVYGSTFKNAHLPLILLQKKAIRI